MTTCSLYADDGTADAHDGLVKSNGGSIDTADCFSKSGDGILGIYAGNLSVQIADRYVKADESSFVKSDDGFVKSDYAFPENGDGFLKIEVGFPQSEDACVNWSNGVVPTDNGIL